MSLNVIFMGTHKFSIPSLEELIKNNFNIVTVYTQPPKKSKRGQRINISEVEEFSRKKKLNIRNPIGLNNDEELKIFKDLRPDVVVVVAYGQIIPKKFLEIPKFGFIAGSQVESGSITRDSLVRIIREEEEILNEGKISSLKRFKDDVNTVDAGLECGIGVEGIKKYLPGDRIIAYKINEIKRKLS